MKKKLLSVLLALSLLLSAALPAAALDLEMARELLAYYYVDPIPEEILSLDSLDEILDALGDPYTEYLSAEEYATFLNSVNGDSITGIGVSIGSAFQNGYIILSVLPKSPALEAGLEAGDRIIAVDGVALTPSMDVTARIGGAENTPVTLTVVRQADGATCDFVMNRSRVDIPIVTYEQTGTAGYLDCVSFGESTAATVQEALEALDAKVSTWIMDVRNNPGGTSEAACDTAGLFTGKGLVVLFCDSFGNAQSQFSFSEDLTDKPLIVLTSPYTASAAELFSAAVRDYGAGISVGQRTFGKGVAQYAIDSTNSFGAFDGDCLKITTFRFYSPDGATNHSVGVLPTLAVSPENAETVALLLSGKAAPRPENQIKLELAGQTLAVDLADALKSENRAALTELLEALPPSAKLYDGTGISWQETSPSALAGKLKLDYTPRTFSDCSLSPFRREIDTLSVYGLLSGCDDGGFHPGDSITRAEFCSMVASALHLPAGRSGVFPDVPDGAWYAGAVSAMAARGFIAGCGDGAFHPDDTITYEQMVAVLSNVAAWASVHGLILQSEGVPISEWPDYYAFSDWAQTPARVLDKLGVLAKDYVPSAPGTRQLAAGLLCTLMENTRLIWD